MAKHRLLLSVATAAVILALPLIQAQAPFQWRHIPDRREQPAVVEPLDPFECREFHGFEMPPRASTADDLGLVEPDHRFGEGIDAPICQECRDMARQAAPVSTARDRWSMMSALKISRATNRFRQRMMSFLDRPWAVRRVT